MPRKYLKPIPIIILLLSFSFIHGCSTTKNKKPDSPSKLLREAKRFYIAGDPQRTKDNINIIKGLDNKGDLCNLENIKYLNKNLKVDFVTADGGFDFTEN